jgi:hypothetical protein
MRLPEIKIQINGIEYDNSYTSDIRIDRTNLDEELATQAEKYSYYAFLAAEAEFIHACKKQELERLYGQLDSEKRAAAAAAKASGSDFKWTEKMYESEVITDKRYTTLAKEVLEARLLADQLKVCANGFSQRREMLISLASGHRNSLLPHRVIEEQTETAKEIIRQNHRRSPNNKT